MMAQAKHERCKVALVGEGAAFIFGHGCAFHVGWANGTVRFCGEQMARPMCSP